MTKHPNSREERLKIKKKKLAEKKARPKEVVYAEKDNLWDAHYDEFKRRKETETADEVRSYRNEAGLHG